MRKALLGECNVPHGPPRRPHHPARPHPRTVGRTRRHRRLPGRARRPATARGCCAVSDDKVDPEKIRMRTILHTHHTLRQPQHSVDSACTEGNRSICQPAFGPPMMASVVVGGSHRRPLCGSLDAAHVEKVQLTTEASLILGVLPRMLEGHPRWGQTCEQRITTLVTASVKPGTRHYAHLGPQE